MLFAIVDIETTGGHAQSNGITEIAIVTHDGEKIVDVYETLVNPLKPIPRFIQSLTGINDEMVRHAPTFDEIAGQVYERLEGKIFIAHNVNFDYSFVRHQLLEAGYDLNLKKMCTVRLSRKIIPGYPSYSLGKLCHSIGITNRAHHRAAGDAVATAELLSYLIERDTEGHIPVSLKGRNSEQYLPPHLPTAQLEELPPCPGVYYFYSAAGKIVYVGKAKNLQKRVRSHFSNNKTNKQKQDFLRDIHRIDYRECATELMAEVLESAEIRKLWPLYNRSQRGYLARFGLFCYEDRQGYLRLAIEKCRQAMKPLYTFNSIAEGQYQLKVMIGEFELCPRLCNLEAEFDEGCTTCNGYTEPPEYNVRMNAALTWLARQLPSFAVIDKGRHEQERSCILIKEGCVYGMGYLSPDELDAPAEALQEKMEPLQDNDYIRNLVYKHAVSYPSKRINFSGLGAG